MAPDRSTGVQQGRYWSCPIHGIVAPAAFTLPGSKRFRCLMWGCSQVLELVGAVSPEPREGPEYATHEAERCRFESPEARCVLLLGHVGQHVFGGAEPREGRADPRLKVTLYRNSAVKATKETRLTRGGSGYVVATWPEGGTVFQARADFAAGDRARTPAPSVASVLRLTASRLRDPEHRWSVDPAVTLEHLAEKLDKDYPLAEARGFTDAQVERLAGVLWAYEGDPAVDWKGVADPQFGRQGEAVRLRRKAETLLRAVLPKPPPASSTDLPTNEEDR